MRGMVGCLVSGNRVDLLRSGKEYFPALVSAIDAAARDIFLECYIFDPDETGQKVAEALKRAVRRGVATHLLMDGFGSKELPAEVIDDLLGAGVRVLHYRRELPGVRFRRHRLRRLHRKIAVIDGRIAFVGGINVIDDLHTPDHVPPRFDYAVRVEGPLLADIYPAVRRLWTRTAWARFRQAWIVRPRLRPVAAAAGNQRAAFVMRDNLGHRRDIEEAYLAAINGAREEILLANAYFFPGVNFRRALIQAAARGVRVVLLLQGRVEYVLLHYASRALYGSLLAGGVEIHEYHKSFMHAKVAVIDGRWATVGSSNIDPFSLLLSREANVVVEDAGFAGQLRSSLLQAMADGARQVLPERWKQLPWVTRMAVWGGYGIARLLMGVVGYGGDENRERIA
ncbi:MAG: cardiolipin synthase ClsB [Betaproteobacteria bacterium]|nr:cardiolipin synthase ClsB [Betaproteobacteria bacterium]